MPDPQMIPTLIPTGRRQQVTFSPRVAFTNRATAEWADGLLRGDVVVGGDEAALRAIEERLERLESRLVGSVLGIRAYTMADMAELEESK